MQRIHQAIGLIRLAWIRHRYRTPLFILRETLAGFREHHGFNSAASLSFFAMFALIPMALLIFFLLSHLVVSSSYATIKLSMLTGNLIPKFSHRIMIEVYNISRHGAVWGVFGMFALFWAVTPLASALRSVFLNIVGINETRSFLRRQLRDALAVLFILLLFFLFTLSGLAVEKVLAQIIPASLIPGTNNILWPMIFSTLLIAAFYRVFFPIPVAMRHILAGSLLTAILWIAMRPAFGLFLFAYQSYGTIFGGMKNMFISIGWLYYSFAAFLLGTELIATLRKKDALLLKRLFNSEAHAEDYLDKLMSHFGQRWREGDWVFREGDASDAMYYLLRGEVEIARNGEPIRRIGAGEYFGEMALLANAKRAMEARVTSPHADILRIRSSDIETLLTEEPRIAMRFLREMALRARQTDALRAGQ